MPEYLTPGVYVEEFEMGARPIEGVSTSTAGFLGQTERGPTDVKLVTSLSDFNRMYGGDIENSFLYHAVAGFFGNGGQRCYIGRIVKGTAIPALKVVNSVTFKAIGDGNWGNGIGFRIKDASSSAVNFKLEVAYSSEPNPDANKLEKSIVETFDDLSGDPNSSDFYLKKFGCPRYGDPLNNLSNFIKIEWKEGVVTRPENSEFALLQDGKDGDGDLSETDFCGKPDAKPGEKKGLAAFEEIEDISIINVPDLFLVPDEQLRKTLVGRVIEHCEKLKYRFAILDIPKDRRDIGKLSITSEFPQTSKYAAVYYPWIKVFDSKKKALKLVPPGGYIAGIYARSDTERGVHKAPANEQIRGITGLEFPVTKEQQGTLNPRGINVIRYFPGRGILVWGARTAIIDPLWKYINVRRLFIFIEKSIEIGTQWAVFEPNDEKLWARVRATITQFLTNVWRNGALIGKKAEEAFFVKCDRTTMTQDDIDNGRLICVIGIAPVKPAEFVIFRIAQWQGGSATSE